MIDFKLSKEELFEKYNTSDDGLNEREAKRRLADFGLNEIGDSQKKSYVKEYFKQYMHFFAILLEVAALLAIIADYYAPNTGNDILGYAIFMAVIINATFSFWQEYKADKAMEALLKLMPIRVRVWRESKLKSIDSKWLVLGDIIILEEGDKIAADAVILKNRALYINTASVNGESRPSRREEKADAALYRAIDARNMVFAGTSVASGSATALVVATGYATEFGKIATLTKSVKKTLTPMQKEVIKITNILTVIALGMGTAFFILGIFSNQTLLTTTIFAISLIVANIPEGLLPTITLSLSLAGQRMAARNALIKNLDSVQTLGSATVICTDKTGTLTRNEMTLREIRLAGGEHITVSGEGYETEGKFTFANTNESSEKRLYELLLAGTLNSRAVIEEDAFFGDSTELALVCAAKKNSISIDGYEKIDEIPFSSERKMMSSVYTNSAKEILFAKGAVEVLFEKCSFYLDGNNEEQPFDDVLKKQMLDYSRMKHIVF